MSARTLNIVLFAAFVATLALNWMLRTDPTAPNREFIPEMVRTARYNAFSPNGNFPDGKTLQSPMPGTLPRGYRLLHYQAGPAEAQRAAEELPNPWASADAAAVARGAFVFTNFCRACHGASGRGDGPVGQRGFPAPPSLLAEHAVKMKDGQIFHVLTFGQNNMPSYASQLSPDDRWKVILFLRTLQAPSQSAAAGGQR
jgi:mono/diheme cytochrome c family protein